MAKAISKSWWVCALILVPIILFQSETGFTDLLRPADFGDVPDCLTDQLVRTEAEIAELRRRNPLSPEHWPPARRHELDELELELRSGREILLKYKRIAGEARVWRALVQVLEYLPC